MHVVASRDAALVYAVVAYLLLNTSGKSYFSFLPWILLLFILCLMVWALRSWIGHTDYIVKSFRSLTSPLVSPFVFALEIYDLFEAVFNRTPHKAALNTSRREQEERWWQRAQKFQYQPLREGEIRLLITQPTPHFNPGTMRASIEHRALDSAPSNEALFYCWGSSDRTDEILINGMAFPVTQSALRLLLTRRNLDRRLSQRIRVLWIDAIRYQPGRQRGKDGPSATNERNLSASDSSDSVSW